MKRKGLIVSSIVMVIVLVASLTTATYAWFSASSSTWVEGMTVQTVAEEGLNIGALTYSNQDDAAKLFISGDLTFNATDGYAVSPANGLGTSVYFSEVSKFYSASGDGTDANMWAAYNATGEVTQTNEQGDGSILENKAVNVGKATSKSYFYVDLCLYNSKANNQALVISKLNIEVAPSAKAELVEVSKQIAASARIGIFTLGKKTTTQIAAYNATKSASFTTDHAVMYVEPYSLSHKDGTGKFVHTGDPVDVKYLYGEAPVNATKFPTELFTDTVSSGPSDGQHTQNAAILTTQFENKVWQDKTADFKPIEITGTTVAGLTGVKSSEKGIQVAQFDESNQYIPVRIAIWFEGQDPEALSNYAKGGGIKVYTEFGLADFIAG